MLAEEAQQEKSRKDFLCRVHKRSETLLSLVELSKSCHVNVTYPLASVNVK